MSVDRVSTASQTAFFLSQIQNAGNALDKVQEQIASTKNANTYAGFGDKAQVLTATIAANARNTAYTNATKFATRCRHECLEGFWVQVFRMRIQAAHHATYGIF